ncbi:MAG: GNAT family N-acetyltransferase, partial [Eubacterium sp.]
MADIAFIDDLKQIKSLWLNVFAGDDDKTVEYFYKNCVHKKCLGAFCDDKPVSMLFLVDCGYCGKKGAYVYAVCTLPEFRGRGISGSLIEYSKSLGYDFLWLIPASESLFCFYSRFGFETKLYSGERRENRISFN